MATFLDQYGQPVDLTELKKEQAAATVTGVRSVLSGHPSSGLTPVRLARLLRDAEDGDPARYLELAEDMEEKDLHYLGVMGTRKRQVSQLDVTVIPAGDSPEDVKNAELLESWLDRETLEEEFFDILDAIGKGFSVCEIMWDTSERQWMPSALEFRDPRWFRFNRDDGKTLELLAEDGTTSPLIPFKFVTHTHKAKSGLPIRGGLARAAAWTYLFKNYDIKGWVSFAEVYGVPLRLGKYHPGASEEEKEALLRAVANISQDAAAIIPDSMIIEFVKSEIRGSTDLFERLANYMDHQCSKAVLGQTTTTDAISGGHAVSKEHNEVREDIERADAKQLAATVNRDVVRPFIELNRGPQKAYPRLRIGRSEEVNVPQVVEGVSKLVPMGLRVGQKQMRDMLNLQEPDEDEEVLAAPGAPVAEEGARASARDTPRQPDAIEDLAVDALGEDWEEILEPIIGPVQEMVDSSAGFEELKERLAEALAKADPSEVAERLARSMFNARLAGELEVDIDEGA